jgi:hypothetical protein
VRLDRLEQEGHIERMIEPGANQETEGVVAAIEQAHRRERAVLVAHPAVDRESLGNRALGQRGGGDVGLEEGAHRPLAARVESLEVGTCAAAQLALGEDRVGGFGPEHREPEHQRNEQRASHALHGRLSR